MKKYYNFVILIICLLIPPLFSAEIPVFLEDAEGEISVILKVIDSQGNDDIDFLVKHRDISKQEKHKLIIEKMKKRALDKQQAILDEIKHNLEYVSEYKSFWISNVVYLRGDAGFIRYISSRDDVENVFKNLPLMLVMPVDSAIATDFKTGSEPGLDVIGVKTAWEMGLTGEGSIVCNFDTGVDGNHPALLPSWRGSNGASVSESWFDPYTNTDFPVDSHGHGTHTMGTMVGLDGGDTIGVAFGAQWISAAVVDRGGGVQRTIADILSAFQWAADPDGDPSTSDDMPDVINNSWGVPTGYLGACDMTFWEAIDNVEALGIVCLFAAGNEGPFSSTIRTPADRITTQFNSFAVGAINSQTLEIASFSSRGPSGCDSVTIKPEIVAPGVGIRSCDNGGGYISMSGTSMATPHVAGAVAILRQFNPQANPDQIKAALLTGAVDVGPPGEDNNYGYGVLNILKSLYNMPPPDHPLIHTVSVSVIDGENGKADPGETISFGLTMENLGNVSNIYAGLTSLLSGAEVIEGSADLGEIGHLDTVSTMAFEVHISEDLTVGQQIPFALEFFSGDWSQLYRFSIIIGGLTEPAVATITNDNLQMTFSNFGQYGLGDGSINPFGGIGFRYPVGGTDFLYEGAFLITSNGKVSDGARTTIGIPDDDFSPLPGGEPVVVQPGLYSDYDGYAAYSDLVAEEPIGVNINQRCFAWDGPFKFITVEYSLINVSGAALVNVYAGLFCDWDLPLSSGTDDIVGYDDVLSLGYVQDAATGWCVGVKAITSPASSYRAIDNYQELIDGFSEEEKIQFMTEGFVQTQRSIPGNYSHLLSVGPYDIPEGDSEVVAFAFVVGESLDDIRCQADQAFWMYPGLTEVDNANSELPLDISLSQNYPNPFNNSTSIDVKTSAPAKLVIYDISGRRVREFDINQAGTSRIIWNGTNNDGKSVVSGVYFYRLVSDNQSVSRKMILLK